MMPKPVRTERSHSGHARLLGDLERGPDGFPLVVREVPKPSNVPSPYRYSPEWWVYRYEGVEVVLAETGHRRYQLFRVCDLV